MTTVFRMWKKRKLCAEDKKKDIGVSHIRFEFNSQTFAKVLAAFSLFETDSEVLSNEDVVITVTKREYLDKAIKFSMTDVAQKTNANVTVHIYPGTQALMVQGKTGKIMNNHPFISFTDVFLEPLLNRLIKDGTREGEQTKAPCKVEDGGLPVSPVQKKLRGEESESQTKLVPSELGMLPNSGYLAKMKEVEPEMQKNTGKKEEVEPEKEKHIELERILTQDTSQIELGMERENKNFRDTIRYNACGYFETQAEKG